MIELFAMGKVMITWEDEEEKNRIEGEGKGEKKRKKKLIHQVVYL